MSGDMSPAEYARFLRGTIKATFDCPVLVFGSADPDDVVSVAGLQLNEYSCGMLIRNDQGQAVTATEGMTNKERGAYMRENAAEQVVLAFVDPLDALNFLSDHVLHAISLVGEKQNATTSEDMDEMMQQLGGQARADLLALRRAARAYLRTPDEKTRNRLEKLLTEAQP